MQFQMIKLSLTEIHTLFEKSTFLFFKMNTSESEQQKPEVWNKKKIQNTEVSESNETEAKIKDSDNTGKGNGEEPTSEESRQSN